MSPRPDVSEERKNQILNAAEEVFTEKGFDEARMDDIAEETGLSKGTLYLYFKSKDDLIVAILDRIFQSEFHQIEQEDFSTRGATEGIGIFTDLVIKDYDRMLRLMPIAYEFLALAFRNRLVQQALKQYLKRYMDILVPIIQHGIDTGEFRPANAQEVAIAMGAVFEGTILLWVYDKSMIDPGRHIRAGIQLVIGGLRKKGA